MRVARSLLTLGAAAVGSLGAVSGLLLGRVVETPVACLWPVLAGLAAAAAGARLGGRLDEELAELASGLARLADGAPGVRLYRRGGPLGRVTEDFNRAAEAVSAASQTLRADRERLAALLRHVEAGVLLVDARGAVAVANPAACALLGCDPGDMGRPHIEVTRNHHLGELIEKVLQNGEAARAEVVVARGEERRIEVHVAPILSERGTDGAAVLLYDVTDRQRLERLRREFLANVSHELRTPVTAIKGFAETLLEGRPGPEEALRMVGFVHREAERLEALVEELLDVVRLEAAEGSLARARVSLAALVGETVQRFGWRAERRGVRLSLAEPLPEVAVEADGQRLEQALANLLDNALKHTPAGGAVEVGLRRDGDEVHLWVRDTGEGIPASELPFVFDRFYRTPGAARHGGIGLGLAIVKQVAEAHGGRVAVESEVGRGTTFHLRLPCS